MGIRDRNHTSSIRTWLKRCLKHDEFELSSVNNITRGSGCQVWDCLVDRNAIVLKVYAPGFDDYSRIGPVDTARKHARALMELPAFKVLTPRCLGLAVEGDEAALVMEKIVALPFTCAHRVAAARVLAKLHNIEARDFSHDLADLVSLSTPNRGRVGEVPGEPEPQEITLQHGDYFSVNILPAEDGLRVVDWDLLALGDPMWDLGFLLEADRSIDTAESAAVIAAYATLRPINRERLDWQRECWREFWRRRDAPASR